MARSKVFLAFVGYTILISSGTKPVPGGWNRILLEVSDINAEATRLRAAGVKFRREDIVSVQAVRNFGSLIPLGILLSCFNRNNDAHRHRYVYGREVSL